MIIVITLPYFIEREAERIVQRLAHVDLIHLRKPESTSDEMERLIREIPAEYHSRLVLHDHHHLAVKYGLYGIHLNSRNPLPPQGWKGSISRSCHSLEEIKEWLCTVEREKRQKEAFLNQNQMLKEYYEKKSKQQPRIM